MRLPLRIPRLSTPCLRPPSTTSCCRRTYATETLSIPSSVLSPPPTAAVAAASATTAATNTTSTASPATVGLAYRVNRTSTNRIPVYHRYRGGNRVKTMIRLVEGNSMRLRDDVRELLRVDKKNVVANSTNGHVYVKGAYRDAIVTWLENKGF